MGIATRDVIDSRQVDAPLGMTLSIVASIKATVSMRQNRQNLTPNAATFGG